jgi:hypothetical protein
MMVRTGIKCAGIWSSKLLTCCEHGNIHLSSITGGVFLGQLIDCQIREESTPWSWLVGTHVKSVNSLAA